MRIDWLALGMAVVVELLLLGLAAFGGPHGALGAAPWMAQLPGILLVLYPPGGSHFAFKVAAGALLQVALWYMVLSLLRRRHRERAGPTA